MAYRRPGVRLTQIFQDVAPGLATFALPNVHVGPAYQIVHDDLVGSYSGLSVSVPYSSKVAGAIVDIAPAADGDLLAYPLVISLKNLNVEWLPSANTGATDTSTAQIFSDPTSGIFSDVLVQDKIVIPSGANAGTYTIIALIDDNNVKVDIPFVSTASNNTYTVQRHVNGPLVIPNDTAGVVIDVTQVTVPAGLQYQSKDILTSDVHLQYRAFRFEKSNVIKSYASITALQADFGIDQIVPQNPVVYSLFLALTNSVTAANMLELGQEYITIPDEGLAHANAMVILQNSNMYAINVLSQTPTVHQAYTAHVNNLSTPDRKKWRVAIVNRALKTSLVLVDAATIDVGSRTVLVAQTNGANDGTNLDILAAGTSGQFSGLKVGDSVVIASGTNVTPGTYPVIAVPDSSHVQVASAFATGVSSNIHYSVTRPNGLTADGTQLYDPNATFITSGATPGSFINIVSGAPAGRYKIASVDSQAQVSFAAGAIDTGGATTDFAGVEYTVERDMTTDEQAQFIADYTESIGSRRVVHVWPDVVKVNVANVPTEVPGYFLGSSIAALTTGLPTQQGFTNLGVAGYVGVVHSSQYFTDDQLDVIAGGGSMVFAQTELDASEVFVRHQLTTDLSAIKFQEYSVTKNVDFISYFLVQNSEKLIGQFNIYDGLFDELKLRAQKNITFLKDNTKVSNFGGVILAGKLLQLVQDPANIDGVLQKYGMTVPIPLNKLDITLLV